MLCNRNKCNQCLWFFGFYLIILTGLLFSEREGGDLMIAKKKSKFFNSYLRIAYCLNAYCLSALSFFKVLRVLRVFESFECFEGFECFKVLMVLRVLRVSMVLRGF